jgi:hypothetical protein
MRPLSLLLISSVVLTSSINKNEVYHPKQTNTCYSLNGVEQGAAEKMISYFETSKGTDKTEAWLTAWFDKNQLENILDLLSSEIKNGIKIDGIRFYLVYANNQQSSNNLEVILVATRTRTSPPDPAGEGSAHIDYYGLQAAFNSDGKPTHSRSVQGAYLYDNAPCTEDPCKNPDLTYHYVSCKDGHDWVVARSTSGDTINTRSEWLSYCFCQYLFNSIYNSNGMDGLRIYLARGQNPGYPTDRDELLFVPTSRITGGNHADYDGCIQDLSGTLPDCLNNDPEHLKTKWHANLTKREKMIYKKYKKYPFFFGGGYDEGELCPNSCN